MGFISFADRMNNFLNVYKDELVLGASLEKKRVGVLSVRMLSVRPPSAFWRAHNSMRLSRRVLQ